MAAYGQPVIELYDAQLRLPYTQSSVFILRDCLIPRLTYVLCLTRPDLATQFCEHMDARLLTLLERLLGQSAGAIANELVARLKAHLPIRQAGLGLLSLQ